AELRHLLGRIYIGLNNGKKPARNLKLPSGWLRNALTSAKTCKRSITKRNSSMVSAVRRTLLRSLRSERVLGPVRPRARPPSHSDLEDPWPDSVARRHRGLESQPSPRANDSRRAAASRAT